MRRRTFVILTALATLLALHPLRPAHADTTVVVHGLEYPGPVDGVWDQEGWVVLTHGGCDDFRERPTTDIRGAFAYSDDSPPLGERVQGLSLTPHGASSAAGPVAFTDSPSTSTVSMRVKVPSGPAAGRLLAFYFPPGSTDEYWLGVSSVTHPGSGWATIDAAGATYTWRKRSTHGDWTAPQGPSTLSTFVNANGGDGTEPVDGYALLGMAFGCDISTFHYDALRVGSPGNITTYDFEGMPPEELRIRTSAGTVTAGRAVRLEGAPISAWAGVELTLEKRPYGATAFKPVGTATSSYDQSTGEQGWAQLRSRPKVRTEYRWVMPASPAAERSVSPVRVVEVRTAVTASLVDGRLRVGDELVLTGKTTPGKARVSTALQRRQHGRWRTIDTGQTRKDGTYTFSHRVGSPGTWEVRVLVGAAGGNLAGTSPARSAEVR